MKRSGLSLDQAPPEDIPFRYFLTAPLFGVLAGALIMWQGQSLFQNTWHFPTIALTHLITLGWLAMIMIGALYQMVPVLVGGHVPSIGLARWVHATLVLGVLAFVVGFLWTVEWAFLWASIFLLAAFSIFLVQLLISLFRVKADRPTVLAMRISIISLALTVLLGLLMLGQFFNWWSLPHDRILLKNLHLTLGLLGWLGCLVLGVAFHVIPMFFLAEGFPTVSAWRILYAFFASLVGLAISIHWSFPTFVKLLATLPVLFGTFWFVYCLRTLFRRRRRKNVDSTLRFGQQSVIAALVSMLCMVLYLILPQEQLLFVFGLVLLLGFAVPATNGMLYKIVPFLIWLHRFSSLVGKVKVPLMKNIAPDPPARRQWQLSLAAMVVLLSGVLLQQDLVFRVGGALWAGSSGFLFYNLYSAMNIPVVELPAEEVR